MRQQGMRHGASGGSEEAGEAGAPPGLASARVTLTFDNGPEPEVTPAVLDALARRGIRATFFVIGQKLAAPRGRALAERAHAEGHWIGNHSYTHSRPLGEMAAEPGHAEAEIGRTQALIGALSHPDRLYRPYGGGGNLDRRLLSPEARDHLVRHGHSCVLWNALPGDWRDPEGWVETALAQCAALPHALVVLHDLPTGAMRHLDRFLGRLLDGGARCVQEIPDDCMPIRRGEIRAPLDSYVAA
jgi:peptidoglycan/xylan/chitin deacetylase (PgdA/CDA1 family)